MQSYKEYVANKTTGKCALVDISILPSAATGYVCVLTYDHAEIKDAVYEYYGDLGAPEKTCKRMKDSVKLNAAHTLGYLYQKYQNTRKHELFFSSDHKFFKNLKSIINLDEFKTRVFKIKSFNELYKLFAHYNNVFIKLNKASSANNGIIDNDFMNELT